MISLDKVNIFKMFFLFLIIFAIYRYSKDYFILFLSKKTLPKEVLSYKSLSEVPIFSNNYEIISLFNQKKRPLNGFSKDILLYDNINKSNYIISIHKNRSSETLKTTVYWKLNNRGDIIDSISVKDNRLFNCGVFFKNDYYIDWFNTGDKTPKKYHRILDDKNLSIAEVKNYITNATIIDVGVNYSDKKNTKLELFLFDKNGWSILNSKKLYNEIIPIEEENNYQSKEISKLFETKDSETFSIKLEKYLGSFKKRFTILKEEESASLEKKCVVEINAFEKKKRFKTPLISSISYGYPGWYGTGFIKIKSKLISFPFKLEAFENENGGISTGINLYYPIIKTEEDFIILKIGPKKNREHIHDYYGVYILRTKKTP